MDVVVQPSVPWMSLNEQIKDSGLFFPVDPGPSVRVSNLASRSPTKILEHMLTHADRLESVVWSERVAGECTSKTWKVWADGRSAEQMLSDTGQ